MFRRAALITLVALMAGACSTDSGKSVRPTSTATVKILTPSEGDVVESPVVIEIELNGGRLLDVGSQTLTPDTGHFHVSIDGRVVAEENFTTRETLEVESGDRILQIEYVAADHSPFFPRVITTSSFTVK